MTPRMPADVLLCADDFAFNAACSQAIIELAGASSIQATSAMVLSPRWEKDAPILHAARGKASVGLHLDWTSDFARAEGHGMPLGQAMLRAAWGGFSGAATRRVIARQLDLFEKHWGGPPDHIDGHQHVHQFAGHSGCAACGNHRTLRAAPALAAHFQPDSTVSGHQTHAHPGPRCPCVEGIE